MTDLISRQSLDAERVFPTFLFNHFFFQLPKFPHTFWSCVPGNLNCTECSTQMLLADLLSLLEDMLTDFIKFQNLNFSYLFVTFLQEVHFPYGI